MGACDSIAFINEMCNGTFMEHSSKLLSHLNMKISLHRPLFNDFSNFPARHMYIHTTLHMELDYS